MVYGSGSPAFELSACATIKRDTILHRPVNPGITEYTAEGPCEISDAESIQLLAMHGNGLAVVLEPKPEIATVCSTPNGDGEMPSSCSI